MKNRYQECEKELDPIEATYKIDSIVSELYTYVSAMEVLSLGCSNDLSYLISKIKEYSNDCREGIKRESSERLKDTQQSTSKVLSALLSKKLDNSN